ncbi:hypothetical protein [Treponema sp. J25]|uniref:hypothetical protein n=1 Tax=Treponema sp. J25 TaxID=2094121 RepID=UPI001049B500|nr:hypothetical protein [Treponema sp. J25]TCW61306.1 hypothetical protein C5O22_06855 [Treponema sp. J25]
MPDINGYFTTFLEETFYKIEHYDRMPSFFMTLVSASDIWNFLWSHGGLTCGRRDADRAIFPYYTADKVADGRFYTGPYTAIRIREQHGDGMGTSATHTMVWEPFAEEKNPAWNIERNIYKNTSSSKVYFEEINHSLGLCFQYGWLSSHRFGIVRHVRLISLKAETRSLEILDGCQNILPACITATLQNDTSVLLDAYKKTDLEPESGLAIFGVSSIVTDRAEPSEGLLANVGWFSHTTSVYLHPTTVQAFKEGRPLPQDTCIKGLRPSMFTYQQIELGSAKSQAEWYQVFNTSLDACAIVELANLLKDRRAATAALEQDIQAGQAQLEAYLAAADAHQQGGDEMTCVHHKENVLFNIMRGGIFYDTYQVPLADVQDFIAHRNKALAPLATQLFGGMGETTSYQQLLERAGASQNPQFERLCLEYLPLTFSRRHGDPSRPWNRFSIEIQDDQGKPRLNYQGNWRDIFQNWEALAYSYPVYVPGMVAKFLNALTIDGYNPYRITREGIDWEVAEPDNPWSNIGYWGDHQVIYLLKLLELLEATQKEQVYRYLNKKVFSTANVPYRLKTYQEILKNPRDTIAFDHSRHRKIMEEVERYGTDAKLVRSSDGEVVLVNMTTKLLTVLTAKLANYIPGGGIWLNTQRPEWNDANNALAGWGLSMVTLYYLHRYVLFLEQVYQAAPQTEHELPEEVHQLFSQLAHNFAGTPPETLQDPLERRRFVDKNGLLYEEARTKLYDHGYSGRTKTLSSAELLAGVAAFRTHIQSCIRQNKRVDGLYHAYNTLSLDTKGGMHIDYLDEMLEGQVAVLSSNYLSEQEALDLFRAIRRSRLFREDQYSYQLYPEKELPHFLAKNRVQPAEYENIPLLKKMVEQQDRRILAIDIEGIGHFHPSFRNSSYLERALDRLLETNAYDRTLIEQSRGAILSLYEKIFSHRTFTGRSGTFYAYEGLGSIYWHMVSKLLLAVQEQALRTHTPAIRKALIEAYYDVRKGLGFNKTPSHYGAFPMDPYSHTPAGQGAKQPGMTGQVKEGVLTRWGELGLRYQEGLLFIQPQLLQHREFDEHHQLHFTFCGVPFTYELSPNERALRVSTSTGTYERPIDDFSHCHLSREESQALMQRDGSIQHIHIMIKEEDLWK